MCFFNCHQSPGPTKKSTGHRPAPPPPIHLSGAEAHFQEGHRVISTLRLEVVGARSRSCYGRPVPHTMYRALLFHQ